MLIKESIFMKTLSLKKINISILILFLLSAVSLAAPIIVHYLGFKGSEFLPIFFALSLGAYILNPLFLILLALISPILNYLITNMPTPPLLYSLIFEGLIFALITALGKRNSNISFILVSLSALILARLSSVITAIIFNIEIDAWLKGFILGYKGIIINWAFAIIMYLIFKDISN